VTAPASPPPIAPTGLASTLAVTSESALAPTTSALPAGVAAAASPVIAMIPAASTVPAGPAASAASDPLTANGPTSVLAAALASFQPAVPVTVVSALRGTASPPPADGAAPGADSGLSPLPVTAPGSTGGEPAAASVLAGALPDAAASKTQPDAAPGDAQAAPSSAQNLSDLVRGLAPQPARAAGIEQNIAPPVGASEWSSALATQVHWLASNGVSSATLHLSPEHLGPVQVDIDLQSSQVNVSFTAAHADTRAALEQALPRLREMFATGGLALGQATVQQDPRSAAQSGAPGRVTSAPESTDVPTPSPGNRSLGLVDEYA